MGIRKKKNNMLDYLEWRGDLTFDADPFNEVDAVILSVISYVNLDCVAGEEVLGLPKVAKILNSLPDEIKFEGTTVIRPAVEACLKAAGTARFRDVIVSDFSSETDEQKEIQFAAVTFTLPDDTIFAAFRGTDSSLVGWKEDFNMSFSKSVPAQVAAAEYLDRITDKYDRPFRTGGHSKGGNISIWAAAHLPDEKKERLIAVYNNDGPGFTKEFLDSEGYRSIREKVHSFVPESSVIGVLMEYDEYITISSYNPSVAQHMPASWRVSGPAFVRAESRTKSGDQLEKIVRTWKDELTPEEQEQFVDSVYSIISASNAKTLGDFDGNKIRSVLAMQKSYKSMDEEKQKQLVAGLTKMIILAMPERLTEDTGKIRSKIIKKADELGDTIKRKTSGIKLRKLAESKKESE